MDYDQVVTQLQKIILLFSSEVGVVDVPEVNVAYKGQLNPGKLLLVDFDSHKVVENNELKARIANQYPYKEWLDNHKVPKLRRTNLSPTFIK